jgi:hypothetical protein
MKVHGDDHPGVLTLAEIKTQIALGTLTISDLCNIIDQYKQSKYYLSEEVLNFLESYMHTTIHNKNKFYLRDDKDSSEKESK